ncbi:sigma factor G inhibitor Gin [Bacillus sp. HMF5848]|nr:sigma factor G inhibitor Gin [Bacillus sp. HMF5848]RSK25460.1 sigma factor G inhibitor Gin [Bacillus sp. HMF5848]
MNSLTLTQELGETCAICNETRVKGIHLYTTFICMKCEQELIHTETSDPKYKEYLIKLKKASAAIKQFQNEGAQ